MGVFIDDKLVGITSLIRETRQKLRPKPGIYGVFMDRPHRQKDLGRMLINQAIQQAKRMRGVKPD